jgi:hypothetical protein
VPGIKLGGDRGKARRQFVDAGIAQARLEVLGEMIAADEAGARQVDVEILHHAADVEAARPLLERVELLRGEATANDGADRGADDDVGHDAVRGKRVHHADMGEAAGCAAAERQSDCRASQGLRGLRVGRGRVVGMTGACE